MKLNSNDWYSNMASLTKEYSSVNSSSYKKLVRKHYENQKNQGTTGGSSASEKSPLAEIKVDADALAKSAGALTAKGKISLFNQVDGKYDSEAISKAVKEFTEDYNSLLDSSVKTESTGVLKKTVSMINTTKAYKNSLAKVGITIGSDNKLIVDEEKLSKASGSDLKVLFSGFHSFGSKIMTKAAEVSSASTFASLYTKEGSFMQSSDNMFNGLF